MTADLQALDRFILRQKFSPMVNKYEFRAVGPDGDEGDVVLYAQQKRMKLKEDIRFLTHDGGAEVMRLKAQQVFDPRARYTVSDAAGATIGELQKQFGASLLRSTFTLYDAAGQLAATAQERSQGIALVRRFTDFPFLPYHFDFARDGQVLATNERVLGKLRDTYRISFDGDPQRTLDRRLVLATTVAMDALQAR